MFMLDLKFYLQRLTFFMFFTYRAILEGHVGNYLQSKSLLDSSTLDNTSARLEGNVSEWETLLKWLLFGPEMRDFDTST